ILYSVWKKRIASFQHASLLLVVVLLNIAIWFVEQLIHWDFEFLSVSYIISELLMLILYSMLQEYEQLQCQPVTETVVKEALQKEPETVEPEAVVKFDIDQIVEHWSEVVKLSPREQDIFRAILEDKKRKEIAEELCISENTVKTHITNVFSKFEVSTRSELFAKVMQSKIGCE
ncbi:MAG: response regulator transcription factor, partial [Anaerotignum sp.]